jgi:hypothetical protein
MSTDNIDLDIRCCICLSKNTEINIPVKLNADMLFDCECKNNYQNNNNIFCLSCIEDWLQPFNYKTNKLTKIISNNKCLFCRKNFKNNFDNNININKFYTIDLNLLATLDKINNNINCPRCNTNISNRTELILHLENSCPKKIIECNNCTEYYNLNNIKKHIRFDKKCVNIITKSCNICKKNIILHAYNKHINDCPEQKVQCSYCDDIILKQYIKEHSCEDNKLKRKILILKEINKNLITFNQEKLFQFRFQCYNLKPFLKDNILTPPTIDEVNHQINDIFQFSTTFIDLTLFKEPNFLNIPKYNIYNL